jgi:hypothetical protein
MGQSKSANSNASTVSEHKKTAGEVFQQLADQGLLKRDQVWRASATHTVTPGIRTGYEQFDEMLAGRGWPARGLAEVLFKQPGQGELRLFHPALAHLSQTQNRWIVWVAPPYIPYPPALASAGIDLRKLLVVQPTTVKDQLWTIEKALSSCSCSAVMAWPEQIDYKQLRRLQVASKDGDCLGILFRSEAVAQQPSPAELRLRLEPGQDNSAFSDHSIIRLEILKRKGGWPTASFNLPLQDQLNQVTPDFSELRIQQWQMQSPDLVYVEPPKQSPHVLQ